MANKFKLVIVDLGNVLINFNHWVAANKFVRASDRSLNDIYNMLFDSPFTKSFEEGKVTSEEFFLAIKNELSLKMDYSAFLPVWNEIFYLTSDNIEVYQLVHTLKKKYKVIVLSNINQLHFEYLKENFRIFDPFDKIVLSYEVGVRKPDPKIYQYALELFSVRPEEAFYIDDRLDLVEQAERLSIPATQFKSFQGLRLVLEENSILETEKKPASGRK
jgi:putative hydrolase of the HAD superfamily